MKSITDTKRILVAAAVLVSAGAGVLGYSAVAAVAQDSPRPATTKPATAPGPLVIPIEVIDPEGHRLSGVDVIATIWYSRGSEDRESVLERTRTDGQGQVRLEVARERPGSKLSHAVLWAYQPGRAIATTSVGPRPVLLAKIAVPPVIRLALAQPAKWTITVVGPDDRPIAGLRLAPTRLRRTVGRQATLSEVPDALLEPLTVTTDAKGVATLTYLPQKTVPLAIRLAGAGVAPHTLRLAGPKEMNTVLKLARPGGWSASSAQHPASRWPTSRWTSGSRAGAYSGHLVAYPSDPLPTRSFGSILSR